MDDTEDDARYPPKAYPHNRAKKSPLYSQRPVATYYNRHDYVEDEEDDADDDFEDENGVDSDEDDIGRGYPNDFDQSEEFGRYPKRQKLKKSVPNYEFVARATRMSSNHNHGGEADFGGEGWSEQEKFVLLEGWGERFQQLGRSSLRSSDWVEVAAKVSEKLKTQRTEAQCRQMMDSLKRRYRKEKAKGGLNTKWAFFRKMDILMTQENGHVGSSSGGFSLSCGVDSGEYVFMDTGVYLERANMNDEMRDSPCESEEDEEEEEEEDEDKGELSGDMFKGLSVLADSVHKFGEIYEKIESSKREQMLELERMRVDFQRELELQKKQILERAQTEIAKIREGEEEEDDEDDDDDEDTDSDSDGGGGGGGDNVDGEETDGDTGSGDNDSGVNVSE